MLPTRVDVPALSSVGSFLGHTSRPCGECRASSRVEKPRINTVLHEMLDLTPLQVAAITKIISMRPHACSLATRNSWCHKCITHLLHYRWRGEPRVFLQDCFGKGFPQPCKIVLPHIGQVLTVLNAGWLVSSYETFNEPRTNQQTGNLTIETAWMLFSSHFIFKSSSLW